MTQGSQPFESGVARSVDVAAIERELASLWAAAKPGTDSGVVRAALCNLLVLAAADENAVSAAVAEIAAAVPHRALVLLDTAETAGISASIAAHCRRTGPASQVCCEQVTVHAPRTASARVASTVLALLVPELPVVCWARDLDALEAPLLTRLARHLDRLIVDGAAATPSQWVSLDVWRRTHAEVAVADLAWERLAIWRELVAGSFDGAPSEARLQEIAAVQVMHGPDAGGAACLLMGWLASRLGWVAMAANACRDARGEPIALACTTDASALGLQSIRLELRDGAQCVVRRDAAARTVAARLEDPSACAVPRTLVPRDAGDAEWVVRLLQRPARNVAYVEALAATARQAGGGGARAATRRPAG